MRVSGFADGVQDFPGYAFDAAHLESGFVVGDEPQTRGECSGTATHFASGIATRTAWELLHKLRRAMTRPGRERLTGRAEVDETFDGGEEEGVRRTPDTDNGSRSSSPSEEDGAPIRKFPHEAHPSSFEANSCTASSKTDVELDSNIHTDGWEAYVGLEALAYRHEYNFAASFEPISIGAVRHRVHRVAAPD